MSIIPSEVPLVGSENTQKYKGSQLVRADDADDNMIREVDKAIGEGGLILRAGRKI